MSDPTEVTMPVQSIPAGLRPWKPGQSGNPAGRPKGARSKLAEAFLTAAYESFEAHGPATLEVVRVADPSTYVKIMAQLLPKEITGEEGGPLQIVIRRLTEGGE